MIADPAAETDTEESAFPDRDDDAGAQMRLHSPEEWRRAHARLFRDPYDPETTREIRERIRKRFGWNQR